VKKKSRYVPRPIRLDNMSFVKAGITPMTKVSAATNLRIKNHDCLNNIRLGVASKEDIDKVIGVLNMTEALCMMGKGRDWSPEVAAAQDAILEVARKGVSRDMKFVVSGPQLQALNLAMEIHDAQLDACTVQEVERALELVYEVIRNKRARRILEKA